MNLSFLAAVQAATSTDELSPGARIAAIVIMLIGVFILGAILMACENIYKWLTKKKSWTGGFHIKED